MQLRLTSALRRPSMSMTHERTVLKSESLQQQLVELQAFVRQLSCRYHAAASNLSPPEALHEHDTRTHGSQERILAAATGRAASLCACRRSGRHGGPRGRTRDLDSLAAPGLPVLATLFRCPGQRGPRRDGVLTDGPRLPPPPEVARTPLRLHFRRFHPGTDRLW